MTVAGTAEAAPLAGGAMRARLAPFEPRLFVGHVMHLRLRPKRHQFRYSVFAVWLDVDRISATLSGLRRFAENRFGLFGFHHRDHGPRDGGPLRPWVEAQLAEIGAPKPAKIMLLCLPRILGHVFNPLSVYYCYGEDGRLAHVVYEVKNTFGDQHPYAVVASEASDGLARHEHLKEFFVSPFIDMEKTYRFTVNPPGDRLSVRIKETDADGDYLIATWSGDAEPLTDATLRRRFFSHPLLTVKVVIGIHWEALRLALKGVRFLGHPGDDKVVVRRGAESADRAASSAGQGTARPVEEH